MQLYLFIQTYTKHSCMSPQMVFKQVQIQMTVINACHRNILAIYYWRSLFFNTGSLPTLLALKKSSQYGINESYIYTKEVFLCFILDTDTLYKRFFKKKCTGRNNVSLFLLKYQGQLNCFKMKYVNSQQKNFD
jgi:hypothetical protein